jgi:hypothetical protein
MTSKGQSNNLNSICISLPSEGAECGIGVSCLLEDTIGKLDESAKLAWLVLARSGQRITIPDHLFNSALSVKDI